MKLCPSNKVNFNWTKATDKDLIDYKYLTPIYCKNIHAADVVKYNNVNCMSHDHLNQIDTLYSQLCSVLNKLVMIAFLHFKNTYAS